MHIFSVNHSKLTPIKEKSVGRERDIQKLAESNLEAIFGLQFISTEFALMNFRIDTLAFDNEANAFVIVEYKRDKSFSIIDQGYSYLALMLNNKAEFILEYNEKIKRNLKRNDIDWSQSRVIFLAQSFTTHQQSAINFCGLPIELWQVKLFDNSTILYDKIIVSDTKESIQSITKNKMIENVNKEVKVITLDEHLINTSDKVKNIFCQLREKILSLGDGIEEKPQKKYIAYRTNRNFTEIAFQKERLKIHIDLSKPQLRDGKKITRDIRNIGHFGTGVTEVVLDNLEDITYILELIEQSYRASFL